MGLIIESDSDSEKHVNTKKREIIIEEISPVIPEKAVKPKKARTKKLAAPTGKKQQTKKNVKGSLIIESSGSKD